MFNSQKFKFMHLRLDRAPPGILMMKMRRKRRAKKASTTTVTSMLVLKEWQGNRNKLRGFKEPRRIFQSLLSMKKMKWN